MSDLPAPPLFPGGDEEIVTNKRSESKGSVLRVVLAVVVFVGIVAGAFMLLTGGESTPAAAPSSPSSGVVSAPVITEELLQQKNDRAAFYIGRGEIEGANQVMRDILVVNDCQVLNAYFVPLSSKKKAEQAGIEYRTRASTVYPGSMVVSSVAPTDGDMAERGKFVLVGITVRCP